MKYLLFIFMFLFTACQINDDEVVKLIKQKYPLTFQTIEKNAMEKYGDSKDLSSEIIDQCKCFAVVGYLLENPKEIGMERNDFYMFFSLAVIQNSIDQNFSPDKLYKCVKESKTNDAKFACLNANWKGVFNTLIEEIERFNELKEFYPKGKPFDPEKSKHTFFI